MKSEETKKALAHALQQLMEKKPVPKITISEITQACGSSRMTFYYHFKDIYDLVEWACAERMRSAMAMDWGENTWQQGIRAMLDAMRQDKAFLINLFRSVGQEKLEKYIKPVVGKMIMEVLEDQAAGLELSEKGKKRMVVFYSYAFLGVLVEWIRQDMKTPPQEVVDVASAIMPGDFRRALENMSQLEHKKKTEKAKE